MRYRQYAILWTSSATLLACVDADRAISPRLWSDATPARSFDLDAMTLTTFTVPGSTGTFAMDINADDIVVGRYGAGGQTHAFRRNADGSFTNLDYPGATFTVAAGIDNDGDIVGMYALPSAPNERHGFLLKDGVFTTIDPAGSVFTNALGVNTRGEVVGRYCTSLPCGRPGSGKYHGFHWFEGTITSFDVPGSVETNAWKVTPQGEIIGGFRNLGGPNRLYILRDGEFTTFDLPGTVPVAQDDGGMNARGDIAGVTCAASPCDLASPVNHGFVLIKGVLTTIDIPGATNTTVLGINAHGSIAGAYVDASGRNNGFMLTRPD